MNFKTIAASLSQVKRKKDEFGEGNQQCQKCLQVQHVTHENINKPVWTLDVSMQKRTCIFDENFK
jgi:hypothetical protein